MTWLAQVLHVLRKDLRVIRWAGLLYVVAAVLTITAALLSWERWAPLLWAVVVCMSGALLVGQVVHNDSPTRVDSFWATRPLTPSAVFAAKVLMALLVLVVPAVGEWIYLRSHDISVVAATSLAARPIAVYTGLLALAIMVGVLTPNIKVFAIAFGGLVFGGTLAVQLLLWFDIDDVGLPPALLLYVVVLTGIIALGWQQYRTREPRRGYAVAALLVLLTMLIPVDTVAREIARSAMRPRIPALVDTVALRVEEATVRPSGARGLLQIRLRVEDLSPTRQYSIYVQDVSVATDEQPQAALLRSHGTWFREELGGSAGNALLNAGTPEMILNYNITPAEAALLERSDVRVIVHARVVVREMRAELDMAAVAGARVAADGRRVHIARVERAGGIVLHARHSVVPVERRVPPGVEGRFELVNPERNEAIVLTPSYDRNTETSSVLPISHARATYVTLSPGSGGPNRWKRVNPDDAWLTGARLSYVVPVAVGEYRVHAEGRVTPGRQR